MTEPTFLNMEDFRRAAEQKLTQSAYDYYASGSHDQLTLSHNSRVFQEHPLYYKVLVDVSRRDAGLTLFGHRLPAPILVAPTAFHCLADPDGEVATARAAARFGTIMTLSTLSNRPLEEVASAATAGWWFQLYVYKDREATRALIQRAEAAGASALVLTVDAPFLGCREADVRNRFSLPPGLGLVNMLAASQEHGFLPGRPQGSGLAEYFASLIDCALNWTDLDWLRSVSKLPILLKGVVRADDARRALEAGVNGIIVSNHGGRQLDTSPATLQALGPIAQEVQGRVPVLLDGGVRRGTDIIKALALGAQAVLLGRPVLWGLAAQGEAGVLSVLELLARELDLAMALCGTPTLKDIDESLLRPD